MYKISFTTDALKVRSESYLSKLSERFVRLPDTNLFYLGVDYAVNNPNMYRSAAYVLDYKFLDDFMLGWIAGAVASPTKWKQDVGLQLATLFDVDLYQGPHSNYDCIVYDYKLGQKPDIHLLNIDGKIKVKSKLT